MALNWSMRASITPFGKEDGQMGWCWLSNMRDECIMHVKQQFPARIILVQYAHPPRAFPSFIERAAGAGQIEFRRRESDFPTDYRYIYRLHDYIYSARQTNVSALATCNAYSPLINETFFILFFQNPKNTWQIMLFCLFAHSRGAAHKLVCHNFLLVFFFHKIIKL